MGCSSVKRGHAIAKALLMQAALAKR